MDKVVDDFLSVIEDMDIDDLKKATDTLNDMIAYKKDIELLEDEVLKKDRERFRTLRKYESKVKELADTRDKIKRLKEELIKLENKKEQIKKETIDYRKLSDKAAREFLNTKKELKERRKRNIDSTIKIKRTRKKITIKDLEDKKITINGATSIGKINNIYNKRENNNSRKIK